MRIRHYFTSSNSSSYDVVGGGDGGSVGSKGGAEASKSLLLSAGNLSNSMGSLCSIEHEFYGHRSLGHHLLTMDPKSLGDAHPVNSSGLIRPPPPPPRTIFSKPVSPFAGGLVAASRSRSVPSLASAADDQMPNATKATEVRSICDSFHKGRATVFRREQ